ncbi:MAG: YceI family protein [Hymenobacteraceae bacterium]|nr:YceI family protein [Hymenobacteraceae bacterium]
MQKFLLALLVAAPALAAFQTPAARTIYTFDPAASHLTWTGYAEIGSWAPTGTVQLRGGTLTLDANGAIRAGRLEVAMATLTHENADLQTHLRAPDFFDVARFPVATFVLRTVARDSAFGTLTLKGTTHSLRFPVQVIRSSAGLRLTGTAVVDRTQFGVRYNSARFFRDLGDQAIRDDFRLTFDVVARPMQP